MTRGSRRAQHGSTLLIALVMLVLLTLFALSAFNTGETNLKVVSNMQMQSEASTTAQRTIESVISSPLFISNPANAVIDPCGSANTVCTDLNGDGRTDYTTRLTPAPQCVFVRPIKVVELNLESAEDLGCAVGQSQQFGVSGTASGDSLCSNTIWEITAETTGADTGAKVTATQGVAVRVGSDDSANSCM